MQAARADKRALVFYWGDIDKFGHVHGCDSQVDAALEETDTQLRRLAERLPADASLTVTADRGMVDIPFADRIDLAPGMPELDDGVVAIN